MSQPKGDGLAQGGKSSLQNVPISPGSSPRLSRCAKSGGCTSVCGTTPAPSPKRSKASQTGLMAQGPGCPPAPVRDRRCAGAREGPWLERGGLRAHLWEAELQLSPDNTMEEKGAPTLEVGLSATADSLKP